MTTYHWDDKEIESLRDGRSGVLEAINDENGDKRKSPWIGLDSWDSYRTRLYNAYADNEIVLRNATLAQCLECLVEKGAALPTSYFEVSIGEAPTNPSLLLLLKP